MDPGLAWRPIGPCLRPSRADRDHPPREMLNLISGRRLSERRMRRHQRSDGLPGDAASARAHSTQVLDGISHLTYVLFARLIASKKMSGTREKTHGSGDGTSRGTL